MGSRLLCEGEGRPITLTLTPGQCHEYTQVEVLLDQVAIGGKPGWPRRRFDVISGDKGYDCQLVRRRGGQPLIAHKKHKDGSDPQEAEGFDKEQYRRRNVVERLIGRRKE